jgi:hypothetical protein
LVEDKMLKGCPPKDKRINWDTIQLGSASDKDIADRLGVSQPAVRMQRIKRGIPVYRPESWDHSLLGKMSDVDLAVKLHLSRITIFDARKLLGIPCYIPAPRPFEERVCVVCGETVKRDRFRSSPERTTCCLPKPCRNQFVSEKRVYDWNHMAGSNNPNWKGGICFSWGYAYVLNPFHHRAMKSGYAKRATIVLEEKLGRELMDNEIAHHKDKDRSNDSPDNLEAMDISEHSRLHVAEVNRIRSIRIRSIRRNH